jgi:hypothetical protein
MPERLDQEDFADWQAGWPECGLSGARRKRLLMPLLP